jgi:hypothetical protein
MRVNRSEDVTVDLGRSSVAVLELYSTLKFPGTMDKRYGDACGFQFDAYEELRQRF